MADRYEILVKQLTASVLDGPGVVEAPIRKAVEALSAAYGGRSGAPAQAPSALRPYVEKVARHAYKVTDQDIQALRQAGYSEDAIFEFTVSAALGAGLGRLERGHAALRGGK